MMPQMKRFLPWVATLLLAVGIAWYTIEWGRDLGYRSLGFVVWAWFAWLGWLVVGLEILGLKIELSQCYYAVKPFESNLRIYERLGVVLYKQWTINGVHWNRIVRLFGPSHRIIGDRQAMQRWLNLTRSKEAGHAIHLIMTVPALVAAAAIGWFDVLLHIVVLNVLFDMYPIMLQRYNRIRLTTALAGHSALTNDRVSAL